MPFRSRLAGAAAAAWRNIGFICVALVALYCLIHAFDPPRLNWGDSMSDYNVMNSGRNFWKYGFLKLRLTPILLDPHFIDPYNRAFVYTHYPQLPDLMNGLLRDVGLSALWQFRLVALCFSFGSLVFIYRLVAMYWSRWVAQVALGLWVINPLWIQHADYLHHAPYGAFFGYGCVYFLARHLREQKARYFITSGIFLTFSVLASYDYWFYVPILLALVTLEHYGWPPRLPAVRTLATLALFSLAGLAFKFGTNAWVLGGIGPMLADLHFQYAERATDTITRSTYEQGLWVVLYGRVERFFSLLLFPLAAFWLALPFVRRRLAERFAPLNDTGPNPLWMFAAALPFLYLFREIWMGQYYPGLLVVPFYAVGFAAFAAMLMRAERPPARWVAAVLIGALAVNSIVEDAVFPKAFLQPATIQRLSAELDSVAHPGQEILADHVFDASCRYYFGRNCNAIILVQPNIILPSLRSLADPERHPRSGSPEGAIFVHDKHLVDDLYDKGYYYLLGRYGFWPLWANPERYRAAIDTIVHVRDSVLMAGVESLGTKLYDTPDYSVWRINRQPLPGEIPAPSPRN